MRLYDLAPETLVPPGATADGAITDLNRVVTLRDRVVVDINNVAEYWGLHFNTGRGSDLTPHDSPNPVCPWPRAWFEYSWKSAYRPVLPPGEPMPDLRFGFAVDVIEHPEGFAHVAYEMSYYGDPVYAQHLPSGSQWLFVARHAWWVDQQGQFVSENHVGGKAYKQMIRDQYGASEGDIEENLRRNIYAVWLALSFTHCKNVKAVDHETPPKIAAKRTASGKPPGVTYKTLVIDGMKETLRTEGGIAQNGLKKALHICRGHFATYTPDRPLFGKVVGTVWKPMHTRGSRDRGEVRKDYKVVANA
jgi:hypothetical protein